MTINYIIYFVFILYLLYIIFEKYKENFESNNDIYYKLTLTDHNNIRYQLISFSQLNNQYKLRILLDASINNNINFNLLLKNDITDDINNIMDSINSKNYNNYIPYNDILFAIKESDIYNTIINSNSSSIIFKNIMEPLYFLNNTKNHVKSRSCPDTLNNANLHLIGNILSITCINNSINKDLKIQYINFNDDNKTINNNYISLKNITNYSTESSLPDIYQIILSTTQKNINIVKEIL